MTRGPELRGEMVRLRPIEARDADRLWESLHDPVGMRLTGAAGAFTREQVDEWAATVSDRPGRYDWAVTSGAVRGGAPVSDLMLGEIALGEIDENARSANLRLQFLPDYRGRGYGSEAISLVLRFAFDGLRVDGEFEPGLGLHRVSLEVLSINSRAKALYESLGFQVEGRLRDARRDGNGWSDVYVMSLLEDEFRSGLGR